MNPDTLTNETQKPDLNTLAQEAVVLAEQLLANANAQQTASEKAEAKKMAGMMEDPAGKIMTMALSDQAFRSHKPARIANQLKYLVDTYGVPKYMVAWEKAALKVGTEVAQVTPDMVVPFIVGKLRSETSRVILPGEEAKLKAYLEKRYATGTRLNLNQLGEAILGEAEAKKRFEAYLDLIKKPDVEYISVKISSIFSQINMIAYDDTLTEIKERLRVLYRAAQQHEFVSKDGQKSQKFINLDMEEYRDLHLTLDAFKQVLIEDEFLSYKAGIVLQAYLPDTFVEQQKLTDWARKRVERGGATIKVRIVKGANLAMEQVEASLHGWEQAPYTTKADVDANYKRMVIYGMQAENARAVSLGIASHNLFDIAFALKLQEAFGVQDYVEFEMLEGMANHQARAVQDKAGGLLLYAPVVKKEDFHSAISYLVRRLDENTAEENFLRDLFGLEAGGNAWEKQKAFFLSAVERANDVSSEPNRKQDRNTESISFSSADAFENEADTDFSLPANIAWAKSIADKWQDHKPEDISLQISGKFIHTNEKGKGHNPSKPNEAAYNYSLANLEQIEQALKAAKDQQAYWQSVSIQDRKALLLSCATKLAEKRAELIGAVMLDGGKTIPQADVEVSEAIDFASYYARALDLAETDLADADFKPLGTVLITPPWNFPIAITCGGMLSALMAGNTVILKPAPEATLVAWQLVNTLWDAGISKEVLQFVPTTDDEKGKALVSSALVDAVILTGGYETAKLFLGWKPELKLFAETSGKNATIITALADHDQAIKELVYSAFGHNGQKCSASSLAVLEAEVYDNPDFRRQLKDAAESWHVGSPFDLSSHLTPIIREASPELERALSTLEDGESWLLEPKNLGDNLWSPGIKLGVKRGSFFHKTECFGPVLGLMRAENLKDALEIVNDSELGLTSGIQSLDQREIDTWRENIEVGNAYINRGTTGAIVQRQPFGGWKRSAFGNGAKAGGPNYVLSLGTWTAKKDPPDMRVTTPSQSTKQLIADLADAGMNKNSLHYTASRYAHAWQTHFALEHDPSQVLGETNVFRYKPLKTMLLRVQESDSLEDVCKVIIAAKTCSVTLRLSVSPEANLKQLNNLSLNQIIEDDAKFAASLNNYKLARIRTLSPLTESILKASHEAHLPIISEPLLDNGRLELRYYLLEQAVSEKTHRYGNIIPKSL